MAIAAVRAYGELNDFIPMELRQTSIRCAFQGTPAVKDVIESLGIPHVEVELILVNGESVDLAARLAPGDRVAVYPRFTRLDIAPLRRVQRGPLARVAFALDAHLGKLARLLRLLGLDATHADGCADEDLVASAVRAGRIVLTRDRELLKRGALTHGYWVRSTDSVEQAREVVQRFGLAGRVQPFTRCLGCGGVLAPVKKEEVLERIPPRVAAWRDDYRQCTGCGKLYWEGTHHPRLRATVRRILEGAALNGTG
ncbi:MAG TPA: twitching motility protein PilT [Candidatus Acetothermia bacterium]|nr:twitching motility protein PilT [Candidatus Acetothermia bacterium]